MNRTIEALLTTRSQQTIFIETMRKRGVPDRTIWLEMVDWDKSVVLLQRVSCRR